MPSLENELHQLHVMNQMVDMLHPDSTIKSEAELEEERMKEDDAKDMEDELDPADVDADRDEELSREIISQEVTE
jgi:hypothetical protein